MDILGQLIVGIGTAALAVVTWASVYETQQVVSGEDLRFRQSRMPLVVLSAMPEPNWSSDDKRGIEVKFGNVGDGPAQNIRISVEGTVGLRWQVQKVRVDLGRKVTDPPTEGGTVEEAVPTAFLRAGSYLKNGQDGSGFVLTPQLAAPASTEDQLVVNVSPTWSIKAVTIRYTDVFGEEFTTVHSVRPGARFLKDFEESRPKAYLKSSASLT